MMQFDEPATDSIALAVARLKGALIRKVLRVQQHVSCAGCGLCCTERFNSVRVLPIEGAVIAHHLQSLKPRRRRDLLARLRDAVRRYRLRNDGKLAHYTCPFLERDFSCALPFAVKPLACLSFNPVDRERCDQDERDYSRLFGPLDALNAQHFRSARRAAIPVQVLAFMDREPGPGAAATRADRK